MQLSSCIEGHSVFSEILASMRCTAKQMAMTVTFVAVIEELTSKAEKLKDNAKRNMNLFQKGRGGRGGRGCGHGGGRGGDHSNDNHLPAAEYNALTQEEKRRLNRDRAAFLREYSACQSCSSGTTATGIVPAMINATTTTPATAATADDASAMTTPTLRQIMSTAVQPATEIGQLAVHQDPDGTQYSI